MYFSAALSRSRQAPPGARVPRRTQHDDAFRWPGGESYAEFRARVLRALSRLAARHPGATVAVFTHSGVISQVLGTLRGRLAAQWERDRPEPMSATTVTWHGARPQALLEFKSRDWFRPVPRPLG